MLMSLDDNLIDPIDSIPAVALDGVGPSSASSAGHVSEEGPETHANPNKAARVRLLETDEAEQLPFSTRLKLLPRNEVLRWRRKHGKEEAWAQNALSWPWLLQVFMIYPATLIFVCSIGLLVGSSVSQTGSDGSGVLFPVLAISLFSIFLMIPVTPFAHRMAWPLPTFFLLVFLATFIYNLAAFPFNNNNRYKAFFQQAVDLDTGVTAVRIGGIEKYVRPMIASLPSATGKKVECGITAPPRTGIVMCEYDGSAVMPDISKALTSGTKERSIKKFDDWLSFNVSRVNGQPKARFSIDAANSKACQLRFDRPISNFSVAGNSGLDTRFGELPSTGLDQIKLWRRDWDKVWDVVVEWEDDAVKSSLQASAGGQQTQDMRQDDKSGSFDHPELKRSSTACTGRKSETPLSRHRA